ncbi:GNAT family protein [uncultured Chitinophaga sp.]|uniref:GNAT family N-acetyltransferase n=1 Tax=uncultured Chitinophaga sp. TaxID=339340 RepID=UPI0025F91DE4|nr:GNAT family protein [uncultured Chitinophaga sp.]
MITHPLTLSGRVVTLEPLETPLLPELEALTQDERIWEFYSENYAKRENFVELYEKSFNGREAGTHYAFAVRLNETGKLIGSTQYFDISTKHRNLEIGYTWYLPEYWGTAVNLESKQLLLTYAFETLRMVRVQIKTGDTNKRSQKAIAKIGGRFEGVLRKAKVMENGQYRNTVYFSIIDEEWPAVKLHLKKLLEEKMD